MTSRSLVALCVASAVLVTSAVGLAAPPAGAAPPGPSETQMVSVAATLPPTGGGAASGYGSSAGYSSISADGRYVVFASNARDIGPVGPARVNVFLRDTQTGSTALISTPTKNDEFFGPVISDDGNTVAFKSTSTDLGAPDGSPQVYVWRRGTGAIELVSVNNDPVPVAADRQVKDIALSGDGSVVAFTTAASNLTAAPTFGTYQAYVRDLTTRTTTLASSADGEPVDTAATTAVDSPTLSRDGRRVAFVTAADLSGIGSGGIDQVWVRDVASRRTYLVSDTADHAAGGGGASSEPSISADGDRVAFLSSARNLVEPPIPASGTQAFVKDLGTNGTELVSRAYGGSVPLRASAESPAISGDGTAVAFVTLAPDASVEGRSLPRGIRQVYVRQLDAASTQLVSRDIAETSAGDLDSFEPDISSDGSRISFSSNATNLTSEATHGVTQVFVRNISRRTSMERVGGDTRYAVSAATSARTFAPGVPVAIVASGAVYSDALSAAALTTHFVTAERRGGPVLLTRKDSLPSEVLAELERLKPAQIIVMGGMATISQEVESALGALAPRIFRISGADRYEVSSASADYFGASPVAYVASGQVFTDALSVSAVAGRSVAPVLLTRNDRVPDSISAALKRIKPARIVVVGGESSISNDVLTSLEAIAPTTRLGGADRYAVSANASASAFEARSSVAYVVSGTVYGDAISGSPAAVQTGAPVLLTGRDALPATIAAELTRLKPAKIVVLGGPASVSESVYASLSRYLVP